MAPTLCDGDRLLVAPYGSGEGPRDGDVVLARGPGGLVAHRIVAHWRDGIVTRGDACSSDDPAIPIDDVLARVITVDKTGRGEP